MAMSFIPADTSAEAIAAIEDVNSRIEDVFARVTEMLELLEGDER